MIAILIAAYEMGGAFGWGVLALFAGVPAIVLLLALWRATPQNRRPARLSR